MSLSNDEAKKILYPYRHQVARITLVSDYRISASLSDKEKIQAALALLPATGPLKSQRHLYLLTAISVMFELVPADDPQHAELEQALRAALARCPDE